MTPSLWDHAFAALLLVVVPAFSVLFGTREALASLDTEDERVREYRTSIALQWVATLALAALWLARDRDPALLGLTLAVGGGTGGDVGLLAALAASAAVVVVLERQLRRVRADPEAAERMREEVGELAAMIPRTERGMWHARAASVTAGVCEELCVRGFLIWYLSNWTGAWTAMFVASAVFGLAHAYQGPRGIARTALVGVLLGAVYLGSGWIWLAMLLHAYVDLNQFQSAHEVVPDDPAQE